MTASNPIYPMHSNSGCGAVINGNFVAVTYWPSADGNRYSASVYAFLSDRNARHEIFDSLEEAVKWAAAAAGSHQGQAYPEDKIVYWEMKGSHAITVAQTEDGGYKREIVEMRWDVDPSPIRDRKKFQEFDEALQHARDSVDDYEKQEEEHRRTIREIGDALAGAAGI